MPQILDHAYLVGKLTKFKNCWYKSVRILEVLKLLFQQFLNLTSSQRDMSGPRLNALSNNRWSERFCKSTRKDKAKRTKPQRLSRFQFHQRESPNVPRNSQTSQNWMDISRHLYLKRSKFRMKNLNNEKNVDGGFSISPHSFFFPRILRFFVHGQRRFTGKYVILNMYALMNCILCNALKRPEIGHWTLCWARRGVVVIHTLPSFPKIQPNKEKKKDAQGVSSWTKEWSGWFLKQDADGD